MCNIFGSPSTGHWAYFWLAFKEFCNWVRRTEFGSMMLTHGLRASNSGPETSLRVRPWWSPARVTSWSSSSQPPASGLKILITMSKLSGRWRILWVLLQLTPRCCGRKMTALTSKSKIIVATLNINKASWHVRIATWTSTRSESQYRNLLDIK